METSFKFCCKMAFSSSAYMDVQGHVQNIFDGSFRCKDSVIAKSRRFFSVQVATRRRGNEGYFPRGLGTTIKFLPLEFLGASHRIT